MKKKNDPQTLPATKKDEPFLGTEAARGYYSFNIGPLMVKIKEFSEY